MAAGFGPVVFSAPSSGSAIAEGVGSSLNSLSQLLTQLAFMNIANKQKQAEFQQEVAARRSLVELQAQSQKELAAQQEAAAGSRLEKQLQSSSAEAAAGREFTKEQNRLNRENQLKSIKLTKDESKDPLKEFLTYMQAGQAFGVDPRAKEVADVFSKYQKTGDLADLAPLQLAQGDLANFATQVDLEAFKKSLPSNKKAEFDNIIKLATANPIIGAPKLKQYIAAEARSRFKYVPDVSPQPLTGGEGLIGQMGFGIGVPGPGFLDPNDPNTRAYLQALRTGQNQNLTIGNSP